MLKWRSNRGSQLPSLRYRADGSPPTEGIRRGALAEETPWAPERGALDDCEYPHLPGVVGPFGPLYRPVGARHRAEGESGHDWPSRVRTLSGVARDPGPEMTLGRACCIVVHKGDCRP